MKKQGAPTGSVTYSPRKKKQLAAARRSEERRWASLAGPVEVRKVSPEKGSRGGEAPG